MLQTLQQWTETSGFFIWLRESPSIWAFPTVYFIHTIGLIFTAGTSIVVSARLLGAAPALPTAPLARLFRPIWLGFWLTTLSGIVMVGSDLEAKLGNRLFPMKMVFVAAAVACMLLLRRRVGQSSVSASTRGLAFASLVCWAGAVAAGRFMAYFQ
jgi:hypothetical protein